MNTMLRKHIDPLTNQVLAYNKSQNISRLAVPRLENVDKKLSYCCDSRSYCMQYFNAIFTVIATSQPLNKKIRLLSVHGANNYCGSASASRRVRSPHTSVVH